MPNTSSETPLPRGSQALLLASILLSLASTLVFLPGLSGSFIFDDTANILENWAIQISSLDPESLLYAAYSFQPGSGTRPLAMLTFALDFWRGGGPDPQVFKTTNLLIHALTTFVLAFFFRNLFTLSGRSQRQADMAALTLALLWAIHPLQVSSVLYVVQRMQTLSTLFLVLALLAYLAARRAQIEGRSSRTAWLLVLFSWGMAFLAKEDAAILPAYALAIELTVLRFRASSNETAKLLRSVYAILTLSGILAYIAVIVPHFWSTAPYPGRDFNTYERLLTQGRVLVMYLGQILLPLPHLLPFYYDDLSPSRGLSTPPSTLAALLLLLGLLAAAWHLRHRLPLFSLGVFLFFAGHFITSNVIGLELAFEHRNHFPLIGAVLSLGDLAIVVARRCTVPPRIAAFFVVALLTVTGFLAWQRASLWGDPLRLAEKTVEYAPNSVRAWVALCNTYYNLSGSKPDSPYLELAVKTCEKGGEIPHSATALANVVIFKTIQGTVTDADWQRFLDRLRSLPLTAEHKQLTWVMINNVVKGIPLDPEKVYQTLKIITDRTTYTAREYVNLGYFMLQYTDHRGEAFPYLEQAVHAAKPGDPVIVNMLADLDQGGFEGWHDTLKEMAIAEGKLIVSAP